MIFYGIELAIGTDVKSLVVEGGTALPTTNLAAGRLFFNKTSHTLYFHNGSAWTIIGGGPQGTFVTSFNSRTGAVNLLSADLPIATTAAVGGVRIGTGLTMNGNVLSATVPAVVTEIPNGSRLLWAQPIAPVGWTQVTDITANNRLLRVVNVSHGSQGNNGTGGNGYGGTDSPIVNDSIVSHTHTYSGTTNSVDLAHTHTYGKVTTNSVGYWPGGAVWAGEPEDTNSGGMSANNWHSHTWSGTTAGPAGGPVVGSWTPMYLNLILCRKGA